MRVRAPEHWFDERDAKVRPRDSDGQPGEAGPADVRDLDTRGDRVDQRHQEVGDVPLPELVALAGPSSPHSSPRSQYSDIPLYRFSVLPVNREGPRGPSPRLLNPASLRPDDDSTRRRLTLGLAHEAGDHLVVRDLALVRVQRRHA